MRETYTYNGQQVVLSMVKLPGINGDWEIMLSTPNYSKEYECIAAKTESEAIEVYNRLRAKYKPDDKKKPSGPQPLTGKYAKLRDDLITARKIGLDRAANIDDGGTCNFDSPALELPRWQTEKIKQACKEAGCGCFKWFSGVWVISSRTPGMANKRTTAAERMTKALQDLGYTALTYYRID